MKNASPIQHIRSKEGNCWIWGCATLAVVAIVGTIALSLFIRSALIKFKDDYTDVSSVALPVSELTEEERITLIERFDTYAESVNADNETEPLILDSDDINGLIQFHPDFKKFKDRVYVTLKGDELHGEVSVPLDAIPFMGGRYFNGSAVFDVEVKNGVARVFVLEAAVKDESVPEDAMREISKQNLADNFQKDPKIQESLAQLKSVEVKDGKMIITPKSDAKEFQEFEVLETEPVNNEA